MRYLDNSDGVDWPGYGRTYGEEHYSPLTEIDGDSVGGLGLAWFLDLKPLENSATEPVAVDGILYFATGLSVVHAVDAATGRVLWVYDPKVAEKAGLNLRLAWGVRGIAWWRGKVYTGTQDGRLIAIDASTGKLAWTVQTFPTDYSAHINGAPRVCDGSVIVGYASTTGATRGFVTAYDALTGRKFWRFFSVPGDPENGFENRAMKAAAKTWAGKWWRFGGGGDVWNAMACDPETKTVFIGTGSGYPWNRRVRSADQGDNLFIASIVALDVRTGSYKWHYQTTPGDTWDFDATMDIELADLVIGGRLRKVLLQASKNGFFYVLDRLTGKLITAEPYAKVTWAERIDIESGRPVEAAGARYSNGICAAIWPSGIGAHSWMPMAYSPKARLAYIPEIDFGNLISDRGVDLRNWTPPMDRTVDGAISGCAQVPGAAQRPKPASGALLAWNPVTQRQIWRVSYPTYLNGGVLATGGNLVFEGSMNGVLEAFAADTGMLLWSFPAGAPIISAPITYSVNGKQYVTVLTGLGMGMVAGAPALIEGIERYGIDPRTQVRRVLTFAIGGSKVLPPAGHTSPPPEDPTFKADPTTARAGEALYDQHCATCHGANVVGIMQAPDLRRSAVPISVNAFSTVVRGGALVSKGMPAFGELSAEHLQELRQYIRSEAEELRERTVQHVK